MHTRICLYIHNIYIFIYASVGEQRATETIKSSILFLEFKNLTYKSWKFTKKISINYVKWSVFYK